jgi:hypothetical protein
VIAGRGQERRDVRDLEIGRATEEVRDADRAHGAVGQAPYDSCLGPVEQPAPETPVAVIGMDEDRHEMMDAAGPEAPLRLRSADQARSRPGEHDVPLRVLAGQMRVVVPKARLRRDPVDAVVPIDRRDEAGKLREVPIDVERPDLDARDRDPCAGVGT